MKRKRCPDCKTEVANKTRMCPVCGYSFYKQLKQERNGFINLKVNERPERKPYYIRNHDKEHQDHLLVSIDKKIDLLLLHVKLQAADHTTEKFLKRIDEKLTALLNASKKKTWVRATVITELTGWDKEGMRKARRYNIIETRKKENVLEYCLESLPQMFIKNTRLCNK